MNRTRMKPFTVPKPGDFDASCWISQGDASAIDCARCEVNFTHGIRFKINSGNAKKSPTCSSRWTCKACEKERPANDVSPRPDISLVCRYAGSALTLPQANNIWTEMQDAQITPGNFGTAADMVDQQTLWILEVSTVAHSATCEARWHETLADRNSRHLACPPCHNTMSLEISVLKTGMATPANLGCYEDFQPLLKQVSLLIGMPQHQFQCLKQQQRRKIYDRILEHYKGDTPVGVLPGMIAARAAVTTVGSENTMGIPYLASWELWCEPQRDTHLKITTEQVITGDDRSDGADELSMIEEFRAVFFVPGHSARVAKSMFEMNDAVIQVSLDYRHQEFANRTQLRGSYVAALQLPDGTEHAFAIMLSDRQENLAGINLFLNRLKEAFPMLDNERVTWFGDDAFHEPVTQSYPLSQFIADWYHLSQNMKAGKIPDREAVRWMLLETTADGVRRRYAALSRQTREYLEGRKGDITDMALANRRNTSLGTTMCALVEQLNAAHTKTGLRRMRLVSVLLQFARDTYRRLKLSYDAAARLDEQLGPGVPTPYYTKHMDKIIARVASCVAKDEINTADFGKLTAVSEYVAKKEIIRMMDVECLKRVFASDDVVVWNNDSEGICPCHCLPRTARLCQHIIALCAKLGITLVVHPYFRVRTVVKIFNNEEPSISIGLTPLVPSSPSDERHYNLSTVTQVVVGRPKKSYKATLPRSADRNSDDNRDDDEADDDDDPEFPRGRQLIPIRQSASSTTNPTNNDANANNVDHTNNDANANNVDGDDSQRPSTINNPVPLAVPTTRVSDFTDNDREFTDNDREITDNDRDDSGNDRHDSDNNRHDSDDARHDSDVGREDVGASLAEDGTDSDVMSIHSHTEDHLDTDLPYFERKSTFSFALSLPRVLTPSAAHRHTVADARKGFLARLASSTAVSTSTKGTKTILTASPSSTTTQPVKSITRTLSTAPAPSTHVTRTISTIVTTALSPSTRTLAPTPIPTTKVSTPSTATQTTLSATSTRDTVPASTTSTFDSSSPTRSVYSPTPTNTPQPAGYSTGRSRLRSPRETGTLASKRDVTRVVRRPLASTNPVGRPAGKQFRINEYGTITMPKGPKNCSRCKLNGHLTRNCREKLRQDGVSVRYLRELKKRKGKNGKVALDREGDDDDDEEEESLSLQIARAQRNPKRKAKPDRPRACKIKKAAVVIDEESNNIARGSDDDVSIYSNFHTSEELDEHVRLRLQGTTSAQGSLIKVFEVVGRMIVKFEVTRGEANTIIEKVEGTLPTKGDVVDITSAIMDYIKTNILSQTPSHTIVIDDNGSYELHRPPAEMEQRVGSIGMIERWLLQGIAVVSAMLMEDLRSRQQATSEILSTTPSDDDSFECVICKDHVTDRNPLPCPQCTLGETIHYVHTTCIVIWIVQHQQDTCPCCRSRLTVRAIRRVTTPSSPAMRVIADVDSTQLTPTQLAIAVLDEAAKMMTIGVGPARTAAGFGKKHMLNDTELDNACRSILSLEQYHEHQAVPRTGIVASTGRLNFFGPNPPFTALDPAYYLSALVTPPYSRPHGTQLQVIHVPERSHWVLTCTEYDHIQTVTNGPVRQVLLDSCRMPNPALHVSPSVVCAFRVLACGPSDQGRCTFTIPPCPQQTGGVACGLFACANYYFCFTGAMNAFAAPHEQNAPCTFRYEVPALYKWYMLLLRQGRWEFNDRINGGYACRDMPPPPHTRIPPQEKRARFPDSIHVSTVAPTSQRRSTRPTKGKRKVKPTKTTPDDIRNGEGKTKGK